MKVSVIIPVFNGGNHIYVSINSLKQQTFNNFEVILIDDGSTDNSISIISDLIIDDIRFRLVSQDNSGPGSARNKGILLAKGDYISFLDSDDYFHRDFLKKMILKVEETDSEIVICDFEKVDINNNTLKQYISKYKNTISNIEAFQDIMQSINITSISPNKIFKKELFETIKYPENIIVNEDTATIYKLVLESKKVSFVNKVLFYYVQHESSSMNKFNTKKLIDRLNVASLVKEDLIDKGLMQGYKKEFIVYYLLNVVLSGTLQITKQSDNWRDDLLNFLNQIDYGIFNIFNIWLLNKYHLKKMFALLLLKINLTLFYKISNRLG